MNHPVQETHVSDVISSFSSHFSEDCLLSLAAAAVAPSGPFGPFEPLPSCHGLGGLHGLGQGQKPTGGLDLDSSSALRFGPVLDYYYLGIGEYRVANDSRPGQLIDSKIMVE